MKMINKPSVMKGEDGIVWEQIFDTFRAVVYFPNSTLPEKMINFGYSAPFLLVFSEKEYDFDEAVSYAKESGLSEIAASYATTVVFINPVSNGTFDSWGNAGEELYQELISNSKIHQYHEDGYAILNNRFTHEVDGYAIRGAIFRAFIFAEGSAADYVGRTLIKTIEGDGLWGKADIAPTVCVLRGLSAVPLFERKDMPVVSIDNSSEIDEVIRNNSYACEIIKSDAGVINYRKIFEEFIYTFKRWGWHGELSQEPDLEKLGMTEEPCVVTVKTSEDNCGDYAGTKEHLLGYIAYYNNDLFKNGPVPLVLCFHGGGDSAKHIAFVSGWHQVAHDHDFLLVCVEDHLESTASEMMELIDILSAKYDIDRERIYATGFSMGGCKSWDMYQEYPEVFAALAPMDATFEVGLNLYGKPAIKPINRTCAVPVYYIGGEVTPLPELPFQAEKCLDRIKYVFEVNRVVKKYDVSLEDKDNWENKIWGIDGDKVYRIEDKSRESILTLQCFLSDNGNTYTVLGSVDNQGHECRYHSCEYAWRFLSRFKRVNGEIIGGEDVSF